MVPWGRVKRHTNTKSPFTNNDEPTPRVAPSDAEAEAEKSQLRRDAALGAGTPGYLTKQQQHAPPASPENFGGTRWSSSSSGGGSGSSSSSRPVRPEQIADGPDISDEKPAAGESSDGKASPKVSGRRDRPESPYRELGDAPPKPSEHEQGLWVGFLNMFRFEKRRASITGTPSPLLGGPALGESHDLPNPNLALNIPGSAAEESILSGRTIEEGRRGSRKHSVLSPRGTAAVNVASGETADEERMRTFLKVCSCRPSAHHATRHALALIAHAWPLSAHAARVEGRVRLRRQHSSLCVALHNDSAC